MWPALAFGMTTPLSEMTPGSGPTAPTPNEALQTAGARSVFGVHSLLGPARVCYTFEGSDEDTLATDRLFEVEQGKVTSSTVNAVGDGWTKREAAASAAKP